MVQRYTSGEFGGIELNLWEDRIRDLTYRVGTLSYLYLDKPLILK